MAAPPAGQTVYKILTASQWTTFRSTGKFTGSPVDLKDGFIHFSTAQQVTETATKHFLGQQGLWLIAVQENPLQSHWKWEISRNGALFPHLYGMLALEDVLSAQPVKTGNDGQFDFGTL